MQNQSNALRGRVIEMFGTIGNFADAIKWSGRKASYVTTGRQALTVKEAEKCAEVLNIDNSDDLVKLELSVANNDNGKRLIIEINYFDAHQSSVATRTEFENENVIYKEKIIDMLIPPSDVDGKTRHNLARFVVENGVYNCIYHAVIADNEDGTETEFRL